MNAVLRTCAFCGKALTGRRSREHVFSPWLQEVLALKTQQLHTAQYTVQGELDTDQTRSLTFNAHVSGEVCRECNNGWLSQLEVRAKPLLLPLIDGSLAGEVPPSDCKTIAQWLFKTALTLQLAEKRTECAVPPHHFAALYRHGTIPSEVTIAIAAVSRNSQETRYWLMNMPWNGIGDGLAPQVLRDRRPETYKITSRAGHLAWRVTYPFPSVAGARFTEYRSDAIQYIFRGRPGAIFWPPRGFINDLSELDENLVYWTTS